MKILLVSIALFVLAISCVYAVEVPTTVDINADPRVATISLTDSDGGNIQVWANDSRVVNCSGTILDNDGFADMTGINATIYGLNSTMASAPLSGTKYVNSSCAIYGSSGNTSNFQCTYIVHHHTENGTWTCNATVIDTFSRTATNATTNVVDTTLSIDVPTDTINFGAYALGNNSGTTDYPVAPNNTGNVPIDIVLDAYSLTGVPADANAMACDFGSLPVASIVYETSAGVTALSKIALADAPTTVNSNLAPTAFGSVLPTSYSVYFGIIIPASGLYGTCNGFLDVTATTA